MRKTIILLLMITVVFTISGCKKDKEPDIRDSFVAIYSVTETWTENGKALTKPAFSMSVEKSTQQGVFVLLNNFANYGAGITAEATISSNKITFPQQTLSNLRVISGSGTLSDPNLTFTYTETVNSVSVDITATAKKK